MIAPLRRRRDALLSELRAEPGSARLRLCAAKLRRNNTVALAAAALTLAAAAASGAYENAGLALTAAALAFYPTGSLIVAFGDAALTAGQADGEPPAAHGYADQRFIFEATALAMLFLGFLMASGALRLFIFA